MVDTGSLIIIVAAASIWEARVYLSAPFEVRMVMHLSSAQRDVAKLKCPTSRPGS